jgi:hypothetical protein
MHHCAAMQAPPSLTCHSCDNQATGWLRLHVPLPAAHLPQLDDVRKLDLSNPQQMALLHRYVSHNMAAIDLWLAFAVLPKETQQFRSAPGGQRLAPGPAWPWLQWHQRQPAADAAAGAQGPAAGPAAGVSLAPTATCWT